MRILSAIGSRVADLAFGVALTAALTVTFIAALAVFALAVATVLAGMVLLAHT